MSKRFRHEQILKLVRSHPVRSQAELAAGLRRAGVDSTQVTLSRDLKELGLVKTAAGYALLGTATPAAEPGSGVGHIAQEFVRDLRPAHNLLVVKTAPGAAPTVAAALDGAGWAELAGSLAGDDTVLLVFANPRLRLLAERRLRAWLAA